MVDVLRELAEYLEKGIQGVGAHRLEFNSHGIRIRLYRMIFNDSTLERSKMVAWDEIEHLRPVSIGSQLIDLVDELRNELYNDEAEALVIFTGAEQH